MIRSNPAHRQHAPLRVLLLGASFATENRGVAALAGGTLSSIYHAYPEAQVSLLDYSRTPVTYSFRHQDRVYEIATVALRFAKNVFLPRSVFRLLVEAMLLRCLPASRRAARLSQNPVLSAIDSADIVVALSGGDSFSDLYGLRRLLYVTAPQWLVLLLGQRLTLLPQSYGPFRRPWSRAIARTVLNRAEKIFTRDPNGIALLRALAPHAPAQPRFSYDLGFALEPHTVSPDLLRELAHYRAAGPLVGLNVSGLLMGQRDARHQFGLRDDYGPTMRELVVQFVRERHAAVVLVPHVFGIGGESDATATRELWRNLPADVLSRALLWPEPLDQHQVKDLIGRCDFFVGARMHACIAATSQLVPTLALAYSDKFAGVMDALQVGNIVCDLRRHDARAIQAAALRAFDERDTLRALLFGRIPIVREQVLEFFGHTVGPRPRPRSATPFPLPPGKAAA